MAKNYIRLQRQWQFRQDAEVPSGLGLSSGAGIAEPQSAAETAVDSGAAAVPMKATSTLHHGPVTKLSTLLPARERRQHVGPLQCLCREVAAQSQESRRHRWSLPASPLLLPAPRRKAAIQKGPKLPMCADCWVRQTLFRSIPRPPYWFSIRVNLSFRSEQKSHLSSTRKLTGSEEDP